jgi:hypothetical protein
VNEAERIGQAILDLAARLPEERIPTGHPGELGQADLYVSYDAADAIWEIEFTPLDPDRNRLIQDGDLVAAVERCLTLDREKAPHV